MASVKIRSPEEYAKLHQKAFRTAFNFLNAHFPPGTNDDWWDNVPKDLKEAGAGENDLTDLLLAAILDYLEIEWKARKEHETEDQ